jgi:hypothetical protein
MKDVIKEKEFDIRRERSKTVSKKSRFMVVIKQGLKVIVDEP